MNALKAPYPYFGGKSRIAGRVWEILGPVHRYIEPFFGSGAVLLNRPDWRPGERNEIVNDFDCMIANFWRAVKFDPAGVAEWADWPVNHADLAARRNYCLSHKPEVQKMVTLDPEWYDAKIAGYWCWGMSCSIAGCFMDQSQNAAAKKAADTLGSIPEIVVERGALSAPSAIPSLRDSMGVALKNIPVEFSGGIPFLHHTMGVPTSDPTHRPIPSLTATQGLHTAGGGVLAWMCALQNRLRTVKVVCGDWSRVLGGNWQGDGGTCGIFLDPPYGGDTAHSEVYAHDSTTVAGDVRAWCIKRGNDPNLRIILCGYGEEHDELLDHGWRKEAWKANGGYGNQRKDGTNDNCEKERMWISPACVGKRSQSLF